MNFDAITIAGVVGAVAGAVAGGLISRRRTIETEQGPYVLLEPNPAVETEVEGSIDRAAAQWADTRGAPEAAGLVADKIRLGLLLQNRRRRQRHRWHP